MKIMKYFLFAAVAVATMSCEMEILPVENESTTPEAELIPMTFTASYDTDEADTKVAYEDGATVWKVGDKIMVITSNGIATEFEATEVSADGKNATFNGLTENAENYYAVYPASAYKGDATSVTEGKKLYVEILETQQAIAGTFDPSAIFCTANNTGNMFSFTQACAFLKFQLQNPEGLTSIRLAVHGYDNLAGIGYLGTNELGNPEHRYATSDKKLSKHDMITLNAPDGGFEAGVDYFIAMRANSCPNGLRLYFEYAGEDEWKVRSTSSRVFPAQDNENPDKPYGSKGKIRNLGTIDKNLSALTSYDDYMLGKTITIGGIDINKSTYGSATCITNSSSNKTISSKGVYFVDAAAKNVVIEGDAEKLIITSLGENAATITRNGQTAINATSTEDYFILSNINYITTQTSGNVFGAKGTGDFENILFNKVKIEIPENMNMLYSQINILNFNMTDCDVRLHAGTAEKNILQTNTTNTYASVVFKNNIFYATDGARSNFKLFANGNATIASLEVRNNTLANLYTKVSDGYISCKGITAGNIVSNLFYLPTYSENTGGYTGIVKSDATGIKSNLAFYNYDKTPSQRMKASIARNDNSGELYNKAKADNPIPSPDYVNGVFTQSESYKSFGAKR